VLTTSLTALIDVDAAILSQLVLVRDDNSQLQLPDSLVEIRTPIRRMEAHVVSHRFPLPCGLEDGRYFWKGVMTYRVRDIEKTSGFVSQTFNVTQSGLSPQAEERIDETIQNQ
jgi:hypothetical protein